MISETFPTPLDAGFRPVLAFNRDYTVAAKKTGRSEPLVLGLERENKLVSRYETIVLPGTDPATLLYV